MQPNETSSKTNEKVCTVNPQLYPCQKHESVIVKLTELQKDQENTEKSSGDLKQTDAELWKALAGIKKEIKDLTITVKSSQPSPLEQKIQQLFIWGAMGTVITLILTFIWKLLTSNMIKV